MIILALFGASFFGIIILAPLITFIINKFAANNKNIQALFSYIILIVSLIVTIDLLQYFKDIDEENMVQEWTLLIGKYHKTHTTYLHSF